MTVTKQNAALILKDDKYSISEHETQFSFYAFTLLSVSGIIYLLFHVNDNPLAVCIFLIPFLLLLLNNVKYLSIGQYSFQIEYKGVFPFKPFSKKEAYLFDEVKTITAVLKHDKGTVWSAFLTNLVSKYSVATSYNAIEIEFINGKKKTIKIRIYKDKLESFLNLIEKKSSIKIVKFFPNKNDR